MPILPILQVKNLLKALPRNWALRQTSDRNGFGLVRFSLSFPRPRLLPAFCGQVWPVYLPFELKIWAGGHRAWILIVRAEKSRRIWKGLESERQGKMSKENYIIEIPAHRVPAPSKRLKMEGGIIVRVTKWAVCNLCILSSILFYLLLPSGHFPTS